MKVVVLKSLLYYLVMKKAIIPGESKLHKVHQSELFVRMMLCEVTALRAANSPISPFQKGGSVSATLLDFAGPLETVDGAFQGTSTRKREEQQRQ